MRAYGNNWHDYILAEIELGTSEAHVAMAWEERFSDETNRAYDHGVTRMELWHIFDCDDRAEEGLEPRNWTPWGPYEFTDEMLDDDEEQGRQQAEILEDVELDRKLRERP